MRTLPYWVAVALFLAVLSTSASVASAQTQPRQFGGGYVQGYVFGYNMWDELITIGWAEISVSNDVYTFHYSSYSDGSYGFFLPTGTFNMTVQEQGFVSQSKSISVSEGSATTGYNFFLQRSNVPIPEYPTQIFAILTTIAMASALLATRSIKKRKR